MSDRVTISVADGIADVRFARADKLNALDEAQFGAINDVIARLSDMADVRCVLLSGQGDAFCAGIDLSLLASGEPLDLLPRTHGLANRLQNVAWGWRQLPMPVIAAVHGVAFGAGFQIMMGADIRLAAPDARFSIMEARWGLVPDLSGIALLRGVLRNDVARELAYTGRIFDAQEALRLGVVTRLADDPLGQARIVAAAIAANSPRAMQADKRLFNLALDAGAAEILIAESHEQTALLAGDDHAEILRAEREKRPPRFR